MKRSYIKRQNKRMFKGPEYEDPEYLKKIEALPCTIATLGVRATGGGCKGDVVAHHVRTKGAGGRDKGGTIPLCFLHHSEWHDKGRTSFQMKYALDAPKEATLLEERLAA